MREKQEWCKRCKEEFPILKDGGSIVMGYLFPISRFSKKIKDHYEVKHCPGKYLCGNCYFDLTDE